jgi:hypothetical protein
MQLHEQHSCVWVFSALSEAKVTSLAADSKYVDEKANREEVEYFD